MIAGGKAFWIFLVFTSAIFLVIALNIFGYTATIFFTIIVLVAAIILAAFTTYGQSLAGATIGALGRNNNFRLYFLIFLTISSFIVAFKYGGGEPLIFSALKDTKEHVSFFKNEKVEKEINYLLWGEKKMSEEDKNEVGYEFEMTGKTWFWWKFSFSLLFITLLYAPFAFADEVAEFLTGMADKIQSLRDEIKNQVKPPAEQITISGKAKASPGGERFGWFAKFYASDLAADFTTKLLERFAKLFSRV